MLEMLKTVAEQEMPNPLLKTRQDTRQEMPSPLGAHWPEQEMLAPIPSAHTREDNDRWMENLQQPLL